MNNDIPGDTEELTSSFFVYEDDKEERLDKVLFNRFPHFSRTYFQWLIKEGFVLINAKAAKKSTKVQKSDEIDVNFVLTEELELEPENIPLDIIYEDETMLAINKPSGMVVHPAPGNWTGTFVNALLYHCKTLERHDILRPGIVHRLDKETTGVLLAAKTESMHRKLVELFATRQIRKIYYAICIGKPAVDFLIDAPIGRSQKDRKLMEVTARGRVARTRFRVKKTNGVLSLLEVELETGRTHQIRVHLKHAGFPLFGDAKYGSLHVGSKWHAKRPMLHAKTLQFLHPTASKLLIIEAPIPQDMQTIIDML